MDHLAGSGLGERLRLAFDTAERVYLRILRGVILFIATLLILYALWLGLSGLYQISRSPASVVEAEASVTANEIAALPAVVVEAPRSVEKVASKAEQEFYAGFVRRYYALFRVKFEPYRQPDDKRLTRDAFDDAYVQSSARLQALGDGEIDFGRDMADLEGLIRTMTQAAAQAPAIAELKKYQAARKVRVAQEVRRTRTVFRQGWDSYSTACTNWYESPVGCSVRRAVEEPYTETVYSMQFPEGTRSHADIFHQMQDRYFSLLKERRAGNAADAQRRRDEIAAGNFAGDVKLTTALTMLGGFLALMFFFLLIAIERHQRELAKRLAEPRPARDRQAAGT